MKHSSFAFCSREKMMERSIAVSIVEDEEGMRTMLSRFLSSVGMAVTTFSDTAQLFEAWNGVAPDIVVLDVNLPGESGFVAAARIRARSMMGIILLTARTDQSDRLLGLSMGVDHYLAKPVDLRELESVIRNLCRRIEGGINASPTAHTATEAAQWKLHVDSWQLVAPNGNTVELSSAEYQLLLPLFEHPGQPGSREMINTRLGKPRLGVDNRSLDVLVSRVRRKVEGNTGIALPLRAARGSGYVFTGGAVISRAAEA